MHSADPLRAPLLMTSTALVCKKHLLGLFQGVCQIRDPLGKEHSSLTLIAILFQRPPVPARTCPCRQEPEGQTGQPALPESEFRRWADSRREEW